MDTAGETVWGDTIVVAFFREGIAGAVALIVMAPLALMLAAPAGVLAATLFRTIGPPRH